MDPRYEAATAIRHACGGGIAGTYGGIHVQRDGTVERFVTSATNDAENKSDTFQADPGEVARIFDDLRKAAFLGLPGGQPANYGCSFVLIGPSASHGVYWEDMAAGPPSAVKRALDAMNRLKPRVAK